MRRRHRLVIAMLAVAAPARADEVAGVVVDDFNVGMPDVEVRVVGETFLVRTYTDDRGQFRVKGLTSGRYRVEAKRGTVRPGPTPLPRPIRIDREYIRCCTCAMSGSRTFERALGDASRPTHGHVDTRSTVQ